MGVVSKPDLSPALFAKLETLPTQPGCYLMRNAQGQVIYVGKAVQLRSRVRSYFQDQKQHTAKTRRQVAETVDVEWVVTDTELEALILENELIKRYRPQFNIRLKDDKQYPYIKVHWREDFPKISVVRTMLPDGARYYGPFTSGYAVRQTLEALRRVFPYLDCNREITGQDARPCLYFHIKRCVGPCIGAASRAEYRQVIDGLCQFLEGKTEEALAELNRRMLLAAERMQFERAAMYRDQIRAAERIVERQKVVSGKQEDEDVIAFATDQGNACVQVFFIRHGRLIGRESFLLEGMGEDENGELLASFLKQFYDEAAFLPPNILLPKQVEEHAIIEQWLQGKRGAKVTLRIPKRGPKKALVAMATENAASALAAMQAEWQADAHRHTEAVANLQAALELSTPPARIECFDISTLQGTNTVGSMVVFVRGAPRKGDYRRFKVQGVTQTGQPDDYASLREVLRRRFRRAVETPAEGPGQRQDPVWRILPDLLIVDGGKGQLGVASEVLRELGLFEVVPVVGLAKQEEVLFRPGQTAPVRLPPSSPEMYLVQRVRDEAHRFAVSYQRTLRGKAMTQSRLEEVPGVGMKRRQALIKHFGSIDAIRNASPAEIAAVPGMTRQVAERIKELL
ncbi:MAG: excinuclease ABC subunit UvrC [Caldilineales bacterium]|nr:excinuclease ABC subunit UvrC [Caldilineales bacterium]